ncbi:MAG TPA: phosphodiester glycosidase family protein, partial [Bacteroidia bacterium]|nr:phosphodiester glycosidase family protein [Bacteroidia bacterium]
IGSIQNLKKHVEKQGHSLKFAMNGGMFKSDLSPQGLYIENSRILSPIDTNNGEGNFFLKPNGIFYFNKNNEVFICKTNEFLFNANINFATQSGPMLLLNGEIHPAFKKGSTNLNIRNGVGILENNKVIFALSKVEINLYDFAQFFQYMGCKNALYLDGYVSRAYFPEKQWIQTDGNFGVMIGVTNKSK